MWKPRFLALSIYGTIACGNFYQARKALRCAPEQLLARQPLKIGPQTRKPALMRSASIRAAQESPPYERRKKTPFAEREATLRRQRIS
jgi:hypothetical protein